MRSGRGRRWTDCTDCFLLSEAGKQTTKDWNGLSPGTTALMIAVHRNYPEVVGFIYLYEQGKRDANGKTALMKAAEEGHVSCALLLRGETGVQDKDGWTALMWAVWNGHTNCVRLLLSEVGVQATQECNGFPSGATALMIAAHRSHPKIVQLLLPYEQGLKDSEGHTAQWHANNKGYSAQVRKLLKKEGTKRLPPSLNSEVLELRECVNELAVENESLKRGLSSLKNAQEEADDEPSQMSQKVSSLEERLEECREMNRSLRRTLNQKTEEAKAITTCVICLTNPKDTLLQPCGHLCVCSNCAERIMNQTCPFCRIPIESTVKAYF
ncbi:Ankyrin repeat protein 2 [Giardia muris]|uniref:Ankyrin repeat protein 2 n=1 Tax=Giardia muris TaxID=5742 RepID=A0A4Z1T3U2_GIAMU|nr:Ankyrin repeat protein 2 [Giardia muris]|eukprot:TNJ27071.1 Ankyrin repeat protein 2 [Giardia muris]